MEKSKHKLQVYLLQAKAYQRLLEATNHHGGHTRRIHQVSAKVRKAEQNLEKTGSPA